MSELLKRVLVSALAIPTVLGLGLMGGWTLAIPLAAFAGWGAREMYRFAGKRGVHPISWVGVSAAASLVLFATWRPDFASFAPLALTVLGFVGLIASIEGIRTRGPEGNPLAAVSVTVFGAMYSGLGLAFIPLVMALPARFHWASPAEDRLSGLLMICLPLAATWLGDASAYFAGTKWGKERARLAPTISPKKSWVGFWASLVGGAAGGVGWFVAVVERLPGLADVGPLWFGLMGLILGLAAVVGDLLESLFKREAGVKDSGSLFPGHGGVLDRIDSLVLTIPASFVLLTLVASLA